MGNKQTKIQPLGEPLLTNYGSLINPITFQKKLQDKLDMGNNGDMRYIKALTDEELLYIYNNKNDFTFYLDIMRVWIKNEILRRKLNTK